MAARRARVVEHENTFDAQMQKLRSEGSVAATNAVLLCSW
jgi:hypothetical protein